MEMAMLFFSLPDSHSCGSDVPPGGTNDRAKDQTNPTVCTKESINGGEKIAEKNVKELVPEQEDATSRLADQLQLGEIWWKFGIDFIPKPPPHPINVRDINYIQTTCRTKNTLAGVTAPALWRGW